MENTTSLFDQITIIQITGIILFFFGVTLFTVVLRRRRLRQSISGLNNFIVTDRVRISGRTERMLRTLSILLAIAGIGMITLEAINQHAKANIATEETASVALCS